MGCDIHGWIEIKRKERWYQSVDIRSFINRHYAFFGAFFGVRNYMEFDPLFELRGAPSDMHWKTQSDLDEYNGDAHSITHFYVDELDKIDFKKEHEYEDYDGSKKKITLEDIITVDDADEKLLLDLMKHLKTIPSIENVRCIVWFDN